MTVRGLGIGGVLFLTAFLPGAAMADGPPRDPVAAESLFRSGRAAFKRGDFATACKDFAESQRLDPASGTELNLSECEEKLGRTAGAWRHVREAIEQLPADDKRLPIARERLLRLEKIIPRLVVRLKANAPTRSTVMRDGVELGAASLGSPQPVDPGEHVLSVRAPDHADATFRVTIADGETQTVDVGPGPPAVGDPHRLETRPQATIATGSRFQRTTAVVLGGSGAIGVGIGAVFGILAKTTYDQATDKCGAPSAGVRFCTVDGTNGGESARDQARVSTIAFVTGAALLAAGFILFLTAPRDRVVIVKPNLVGTAVATETWR